MSGPPTDVDQLLHLARQHGLPLTPPRADGSPPRPDAARRSAIAAALHLVSGGHLSAADAANVLAGEPPPHSPDDEPRSSPGHAPGAPSGQATESIAELIDRLGLPPQPLVDDWLDQLRGWIAQLEIAPPPPAAGPRSLPSLTSRDFAVDADNRLVPLSFPRSRDFQPNVSLPEGEPATESGRRAVDAFAAAVSRRDHHAATESRRSLRDRSAAAADDRLETHPAPRAAPRRSRRRIRPSVIAVGLGCALPLAAGLLWLARRGADSDGRTPAPQAAAAPEPSAVPAPAPSVISSADPPDTVTAAAAEPLSTFEAIGRLPAAQRTAGDDRLRPVDPLALPPLDVAPLLPAKDRPGEGRPGEGRPGEDRPGEDRPADDTPGDDTPGAGKLATPSAGPPAAPEAAQDLQARPVRGTSVALPDRDDANHWLSLAAASAQQIELEFPSGTASALIRRDASGDRWQVICPSRSEQAATPVAEIQATAAGTRFRWTAAASQVASAAQLHRGRLRIIPADGAAVTLFLRQQVQIDPLAFTFQQPDARIAWPLGDPPDIAGSRLEIDFDLPAELEYGWIESLPVPSSRHATAIAQFTLSDNEFVAVGMRIDTQIATRLTCRVRVAARLDPAMPWQAVSLPGVTRWADRVAAAHIASDASLTRLEALYAIADSHERAALRLRRQALQSQGSAFTLASQRLGKLIQLMQQLQDRSTMRCKLAVHWPDGVIQPILSTADAVPAETVPADAVPADAVPAEPHRTEDPPQP